MQNVIHNNLYSNRRTAATTVSNFQLASTASNKLCPKAAKFDTDFLSKCHQNPFNQASYRWHGRADSCYYSDREAEYCDERVCLQCMCVCACVCVCLSEVISSELHVQSSPNFCARYTYGRSSVLLWRCSDMLCTSGFVDDVIFAHKPT